MPSVWRPAVYPARHLKKVFETETYDEMVLVVAISRSTACANITRHFWGKAHVGYLPRGKVTGLSKLVRVVEEIRVVRASRNG